MSDKEQKSVDVRLHKRLAMGEKLDGTSLKEKGNTNPISSAKAKGGLHHAKKK
jgi:hypothetical protein